MQSIESSDIKLYDTNTIQSCMTPKFDNFIWFSIIKHSLTLTSLKRKLNSCPEEPAACLLKLWNEGLGTLWLSKGYRLPISDAFLGPNNVNNIALWKENGSNVMGVTHNEDDKCRWNKQWANNRDYMTVLPY